MTGEAQIKIASSINCDTKNIQDMQNYGWALILRDTLNSKITPNWVTFYLISA